MALSPSYLRAPRPAPRAPNAPGHGRDNKVGATAADERDGGCELWPVRLSGLLVQIASSSTSPPRRMIMRRSQLRAVGAKQMRPPP